MKVRLLRKSNVPRLGVIQPGEYDLPEEALRGLSYEVLEAPKKVTKKKVTPASVDE